MAIQRDIFLQWHSGFECADLFTTEQMYLRFDDIDASDFLGHCVFHLNSRIDFYEVKIFSLYIH